jgi:hypothetical protein
MIKDDKTILCEMVSKRDKQIEALLDENLRLKKVIKKASMATCLIPLAADNVELQLNGICAHCICEDER